MIQCSTSKRSRFFDRLGCCLFYLSCLLGPFSLYGLDRAVNRQIEELVAANPRQLSTDEYTYLADVIDQCAPCNVLVFGLGRDSTLWYQMNVNGKTVFLEHNPEWYERILAQSPHLQCHFIRYHTKLSDWKILLHRDSRDLAIDLPPEVMETRWDLIFVDAPEGYKETNPGRMQSIYMASILGQRGNSHVFVHDCDRVVEQAYCSRFLGDADLVRSLEKLRHYRFVEK